MITPRQVPLRFTPASIAAGTNVNLSGAGADEHHLWLAGDETATVERLTPVDDGYGEQVSVRLADFVKLPGTDTGEADLEGLAREGEWLWVVGSHSLVREAVRDTDSPAQARERLNTLRHQPNRHVLVRLRIDPTTGLPVRRGSAVLGAHDDDLVRLLGDDPLVSPFLTIPSKDNGLDVEGLAVTGSDAHVTVWIGLRGPVLRGWAVVVELHPTTHPKHPHRLVVDGYRTHLLDLGGLGVRDLTTDTTTDGTDLLVLAGPTMDLDGPTRIHRWRPSADGLARTGDLPVVLELPHGDGDDHPEGMTLLPGTRDLLVVCDSPAPQRIGTDGSVLADVWPLP